MSVQETVPFSPSPKKLEQAVQNYVPENSLRCDWVNLEFAAKSADRVLAQQ
jgi:hypothetical protein